MRRRSAGSILIGNLDPNLKERILNIQLSNQVLKKFEEEEKIEEVSCIIDLRELSTKTESEVYNTLNRMFKNKQYFMYCGPLLLNINPGPTLSNDYLNLENWIKETKNLPEIKWKPHLYSFVHYVYQTLINENKDQVVNMLGHIGSGKTFNLVHIIEYFCYVAGIEGRQAETFDVMHKAIQLIHIMGSIFRQNNMESTSCGMLLRMGFNDEHKICNFDLEAKILDFTLPFSENGRSFSILHSLMTGGNNEIKKMLELPEFDIQLNFFKKFSKNFDNSTKERFRLNDLEIWTRFHSLLNTFKFTKTEVLEILQLFSFILLCNEASIGKKKQGTKEIEEFNIVKGLSSKKLAKMMNISEEDFLKKFGSFKNIQDIKNTLISLMKHTYYIIFEFIKQKVKNCLKIYFENMFGPVVNNAPDKSLINHSFNGNFNASQQTSTYNIKYINFLDFPGEVEDNTLGGFSTNLANECLNIYAGSQYLSVVERLEDEKLNLKYFQPLQSYHIVESLIGSNGLFKYLSNPFTESNYRKFQKKVTSKAFYHKTLELDPENELLFKFKFSHMSLFYNYESLYMETKSLMMNNRILSIFGASKNSIIRSVHKTIVDPNRSFYQFTTQTIKEFFKPLEGISPFVIYCLHSNDSLKIFFGEKYLEQKEHWVIPLGQTNDMLKNSLMMPVLFWEWFGFHEWVDISNFCKEFSGDFEKIKGGVLKNKNNRNNKIKDVPIGQLSPYEIATYILSVLGNNKSYILGATHVILKKGTLKELKKLITGMLDLMNKKKNEGNKPSYLPNNIQNPSSTAVRRGSNSSLTSDYIKNARSKSNMSPYINTTQSSKQSLVAQKNITKKPNQSMNRSNSINSKKKEGNASNYNNSNTSFTFQPINNSNSKAPVSEAPERRQSMKVQCHLNVIDINQVNLLTGVGLNSEVQNNSIVNSNITINNNNNFSPALNYSLFRIINSEQNQTHQLNQSIEDPTSDNELNYEKYKKENNIILPNKQHFNVFKSLLDYSKIESFDVFDYGDHIQEIKLIQNSFRAYKARKKYKIYRYVIRKIIMLQKIVRALMTRKKFKKFQYCHKCIVFIQKLFRIRHQHKFRAATKIQSLWRMKKAQVKLMIKIANRNRRIENGDEDSNYDEEISREEENIYQIQGGKKSKDFEQELLNVSIKTDKKKQYSQAQRFSNKSALSFVELDNETDKNKIIEHLLLDQSLAKGSDSLIFNKSNIPEGLGISNKLRKAVNDANKVKKRAIPKSAKIEDKLIQFGENAKLKRVEAKLENLKKEEVKYSFKPVTNISGLDYGQSNTSFWQRMEYYKQNKEQKIEEIRNKNFDKALSEYTFKPQVSGLAKNLKRGLNDLYDWKEKKEKNLNFKKEMKEIQELENIEKNTMIPKINKNSELIVRQKFERTMQERVVHQIDEFDLWPVNMEKNYFEK